MAEFVFQLPVTVICELLGVPAADRDRFRPLAADLTEVLELSADNPEPGAAAIAAARADRIFHGPDRRTPHQPA
jgi:cytochrome P450